MNAALDGREARVALASSDTPIAGTVSLDETDLTLTPLEGDAVRAVPLDSVQAVSVQAGTPFLPRLGRDVALGVTPGLVVTGIGVGWAIAAMEPSDYVPPLGPCW